MTTTMQVEARRSVTTLFPWRSALVAGAIVALAFAISAPSIDAGEPPAPQLERAHEQLARLMANHAASAMDMRIGLYAVKGSLRRLTVQLRYERPALASALDAELDAALAQVDGDGELLRSDRAEFDVSYLVPLAQTLADIEDSLGSDAR